jgi:nicotinamidase-related amidase
LKLLEIDFHEGGKAMNRTQKDPIYMVLIWALLIGITSFIAFPSYSQQTDKTIVDEWSTVNVPPAPELKEVTLNPKETAFLILDIQKSTCNPETRPRCISSLPKIKDFLQRVRAAKMMVVYSLAGTATVADILPEAAPSGGEPVVQSSVDKFYNTDLDKILKDKGIKTVIICGTAANGAVLHTATGAAVRGFQVILPVDLMSADLYAEQYTAWHLINAPGSRRQTTLTKTSLIKF